MTQWIGLLKAALDLALVAADVFGSKKTAVRFMERTRESLEKTNGNTEKLEQLARDILDT
jgi:uncharacterized protein (DUF2384 family)